MIEYLKSFFNLKHLFTIRPQAMSLRAIIILAVIFSLCIILAIVVKMLIKKNRDGLKLKAYRQIFSLLLTMGILGFLYLFFAWQAIALLGTRFWLLLWAIVLIVWLAFIAKYFFIDTPKIRARIEKKRDFERYIP